MVRGGGVSKYKRISDYDEVQMPEEPGDIVYQACCDCGLVHLIGWCENMDTGEMSIRIMRDDRRTAQLRRYSYGDLHNGNGNWRLVRNEK